MRVHAGAIVMYRRLIFQMWAFLILSTKQKYSNFGFFTDCVLQLSIPQYFLKQITLQLWWQKTSLVEISLVGVGEKDIEMVQYFDKFYISLSVKQYTVLAIVNCEPSLPELEFQA